MNLRISLTILFSLIIQTSLLAQEISSLENIDGFDKVKEMAVPHPQSPSFSQNGQYLSFMCSSYSYVGLMVIDTETWGKQKIR